MPAQIGHNLKRERWFDPDAARLVNPAPHPAIFPDGVNRFVAYLQRARTSWPARMTRSKSGRANSTPSASRTTLCQVPPRRRDPDRELWSGYNPLDAPQKLIEPQIADTQARIDLLKVDQLFRDHILLEGQTLADPWPHLIREDKRRIVKDLVDKITSEAEEVSIELCYIPAPTPCSRDTVNKATQPSHCMGG